MAASVCFKDLLVRSKGYFDMLCWKLCYFIYLNLQRDKDTILFMLIYKGKERFTWTKIESYGV